MAFNKKQSKQSDYECDGRISLWTPQENKKYVISGKVQIGDEVYRVFIYESFKKSNPNSPDYYGSLFLEEEQKEEEQPKRIQFSYKRKQPVKPVVPQFEDDENEEDDDEIVF
jgi:hypothetical protein